VQFVFFYRSLISDWNHTNALFLRGVVKELQQRGHKVPVFEPAEGWSLHNLTRTDGANLLPYLNNFSRLSYGCNLLDARKAFCTGKDSIQTQTRME
jgi:spore maturation protein CgeB